MDIKAIEKFCQKKGREIANILFDTNDSAGFELDSRRIESEIYDIATSYSKIFLFEAKKFLQESVREDVKSHLSSRFDSKQVNKMKDVDLIAHWVKSEAVRVLEENKIFLY